MSFQYSYHMWIYIMSVHSIGKLEIGLSLIDKSLNFL